MSRKVIIVLHMLLLKGPPFALIILLFFPKGYVCKELIKRCRRCSFPFTVSPRVESCCKLEPIPTLPSAGRPSTPRIIPGIAQI